MSLWMWPLTPRLYTFALKVLDLNVGSITTVIWLALLIVIGLWSTTILSPKLLSLVLPRWWTVFSITSGFGPQWICPLPKACSSLLLRWLSTLSKCPSLACLYLHVLSDSYHRYARVASLPSNLHNYLPWPHWPQHLHKRVIAPLNSGHYLILIICIWNDIVKFGDNITELK